MGLCSLYDFVRKPPGQRVSKENDALPGRFSDEIIARCVSKCVKISCVSNSFYVILKNELNNKHERENLQRRLKESGIPSMIYYTKPMHRQKAFKNLQNADSDYKNTIRLCETVLSLPIHPYLSKDDVMKVVDVICTWAS